MTTAIMQSMGSGHSSFGTGTTRYTSMAGLSPHLLVVAIAGCMSTTAHLYIKLLCLICNFVTPANVLRLRLPDTQPYAMKSCHSYMLKLLCDLTKLGWHADHLKLRLVTL
jgi:hypothetical protein